MALPADQFRVGDIWASPRGKHWRVEHIDHHGRAVLRNVDNINSKQRRSTTSIGNNMTDAWLRINPPELIPHQ